MATSSTILINIGLYMFLAIFLLEKKTFFLSASASIFFPRNGGENNELRYEINKVNAALAIIISYPTRASRIIVLLNFPPGGGGGGHKMYQTT